MLAAQYVWLNDKGVKQYSDMPPPAAVPNQRILKSPGPATRAYTNTQGPASAGSGNTALW